MADTDEGVLREWLDALRGLDVTARKMFGCCQVWFRARLYSGWEARPTTRIRSRYFGTLRV